MKSMDIHIVFGNQLFPPTELKKQITKQSPATVFMAETVGLCTYYRFHKHKLIFFLASMREYADELASEGLTVDYHQLSNDLSDSPTYEELLEASIRRCRAKRIVIWEIEDKFMELRIRSFAKRIGLEVIERPSPMFLTSRQEFRSYLGETKKPFMKTFYERQRRKLRILVDEYDEPIGGRWSFDEDNRAKLPKSLVPPHLSFASSTRHSESVSKLVNKRFTSHPGSVENFWLPVTREGATQWLKAFINQRFENFGLYEDAISSQHEFIFHSVLSPLINVGLLLPKDVVTAALSAHKRKGVPLNSTEGFIRQVIGWREFVRGIYQAYSEKQDTANFWKHKRKLGRAWYDGTTGIPPIDDAIKKATRFGYNHHIERLMILSNAMLLSEVEPQSVHRWFMEMYVDSSDWVMGPNVYGMGQFSDGGIFATKPYICGSNYILKMSDYKRGDWCDTLDALYWTFIEKHRAFYSRNPRMSMMAKALDKMAPAKLSQMRERAENFRNHVSR